MIARCILGACITVVVLAGCKSSSSKLDQASGSGSSVAAARAGSGGARAATCENAVDRYIELYTEDAKRTGRDAQAAQVAARRQTFIDDCQQRVADGRFTPEQLACAANAPTLEAGAACVPQERRADATHGAGSAGSGSADTGSSGSSATPGTSGAGSAGTGSTAPGGAGTSK